MAPAAVALLSLAFAAPVPPAEKREVPIALEQKLIGVWEGGPCQGTLTVRANGTYDLKGYSPGGITLAGTWQVKWDALPPTLVLTVEKSDAKDFVGKPWVLKLTRLNDEAMEYEFTATGGVASHERKK